MSEQESIVIHRYHQDVPPSPQALEAFARLNLDWIERYFALEEHDREQLFEAAAHIFAGGGQLFLAEAASGEVVGTCALSRSDGNSWELAKMCVDGAYGGRGIGQRLCEAALSWAKTTDAEKVWLESNRKLEPAIRLYRRVGFVEVASRPSPYARADIWMDYPLRASAS
jgi:putative acetyltransferase